MKADLIDTAYECGTKVSICQQPPKDYAESAALLFEHDIDSMSLNPDSVINVNGRVAEEGSR